MKGKMDWMVILVLVGVVGVLFWLKRSGLISPSDAALHLKNGAAVIDVRSLSEFNSGHLTQAISIPVDQVASAVPQRFPDKDQVLLLYCASGMRSGFAQRRLRGMGYANAFNLGSYARAEALVQQ